MLIEFKKFLSTLQDVSEVKDLGDDTILFSYNGFSFLFAIDKGDQNYIRLLLPRVAEITDFSDVNAVINECNTNYKALKVISLDNYVWLSIEQLIYSKEDNYLLFNRMIHILLFAIRKIQSDYLNN